MYTLISNIELFVYILWPVCLENKNNNDISSFFQDLFLLYIPFF